MSKMASLSKMARIGFIKITYAKINLKAVLEIGFISKKS